MRILPGRCTPHHRYRWQCIASCAASTPVSSVPHFAKGGSEKMITPPGSLGPDSPGDGLLASDWHLTLLDHLGCTAATR